MQVGLCPGHTIFPGPPPPKGHTPPNFRPISVVAQLAQLFKMLLGRKVGLDPSNIVLDRNPPPLLKKGGRAPPIFGPCLLCPNAWMDKDASWYGGRPGPKGPCVIWGPSFPLPKKGQSPQFSAHVYCGQTAAWIKMPLGMEVGLGPGHIVLDGTQLPLPRKGAQPTIFGPCLLQPNGHPSQLLLRTCYN